MSMTLANALATHDDLEAEWVTWIGTLESWDLFSSGEWTWADLEHEIAETIAAW